MQKQRDRSMRSEKPRRKEITITETRKETETRKKHISYSPDRIVWLIVAGWSVFCTAVEACLRLTLHYVVCSLVWRTGLQVWRC